MNDEKDERISGPADDAAHDRFASAARQRFNDSVDSLDASTLSKLNQNRQRALEQAARAPLTPRLPWWMPATGVAAAAAVAAVLWTGGDGRVPMAPPAVATDLEIILEVDDFEMLEDLEFYSWIELDEQADGHVG